MADTAELKHMVMSFRVSELQVLLGFAGRNKSGRKQDLLMRALQLISKGCSTPVQIKIRELYRLMVKTWTNAPQDQPDARRSERCRPGAKPYPSASTRSSDADDRLRYPGKLSGSSSLRGPSSSSNSDPSRHGHLLYNELMTGADYAKHSSHSSTSSQHSSGFPVHPDVRFQRLPFYDVLGELLKPSTLVPRNTSRFQETFFVFHLTPQQAQDIAMSRDMRPGSKCDYQVQVQLRFCLLETSCEQGDNFPPSICVRVNSKIATLPNPIPTNKPGVEPKRPGRPVNITSLCRISPTIPNHVNISWASEFARGYCVGVYLVRKQSSDVLLQRLKAKGIKHADHSRALIKEKLHQDPDSEIATTSLRVSLLCPLGKMRMRCPSRCNTCTHLQCFDAETYLLMNEKKPTWKCPVCDKPATYDSLIIDGLFSKIVQECSQDCNDIQFVEDGSWSPFKQVKKEVIISSPATKTSSTASSSSSSGSAPAPKKPKPAVIDLTWSSSEDDDDDDDPLPLTKKSPQRCVSPMSCAPPLIDVDTPPHYSPKSRGESAASNPVHLDSPIFVASSSSPQSQNSGLSNCITIDYDTTDSSGTRVSNSPRTPNSSVSPRSTLRTPPTLHTTPPPLIPSPQAAHRPISTVAPTISATPSMLHSAHLGLSIPVHNPPPAHTRSHLSSHLQHPFLGTGLGLSSNEVEDFYGMMSGINSFLPSSRYKSYLPSGPSSDDDSSS
ncbi:E3 SUMO-protein ligase PIAS2-like isoform X2 [Lineus longissimus]|uniref:E3 SUMO-protein ligase PIAS2-like isoform X2 n=1 Tax=Lineus longissimus TaxID=88925 RepID=UPI00315DA462